MRIAEFYLFSLSLKVDILSLLCGPTAAGIVVSKILVNFSSLWLLADFHCPWVSVKSIHCPSLTVPAIKNYILAYMLNPYGNIFICFVVMELHIDLLTCKLVFIVYVVL